MVCRYAILSILYCVDNAGRFLQNSENYTSKITRRRFREFLHDNLDLSEEIIMDRIFKYFNTESADDIDLEEWIVGFNVILKGSHIYLYQPAGDSAMTSSCSCSTGVQGAEIESIVYNV